MAPHEVGDVGTRPTIERSRAGAALIELLSSREYAVVFIFYIFRNRYFETVCSIYFYIKK
jgi:hypothetical protein